MKPDAKKLRDLMDGPITHQAKERHVYNMKKSSAQKDIAAVAAATLADPDANAGAQYALSGPEARTLADAATIISQVTGQTIAHVDLDRDAWVAGAVTSGIPSEYGAVLRMLIETIASGRGSRPISDVEKATGTAPTSFVDFTRRTAAAWAVDEAR